MYGARKYQAIMDTGTKDDTGSVKLFWAFGERGTWNGE